VPGRRPRRRPGAARGAAGPQPGVRRSRQCLRGRAGTRCRRGAAMTTTSGSATGMVSGEAASAGATLRRGIALSPELAAGFWVTLLLAMVATVGRVLVPIAVQQAVDRGFN